MTTGYLSPIGVEAQFFNNAGAVLNGGKIATYLAGTATATPTYTDATLGTANANPIILSASGRLPSGVWQQPNVPIKVVISDSLNNVQMTIDNIIGIGDPSVSYPETTAEHAYAVSISVSTIVTNHGYPEGDARRYGCLLDGVTADNAALNTAIAYCIYANANYAPEFNLALQINGQCYIGPSPSPQVMINRLHDSISPNTDNYFYIRSTNGGGFTVGSHNTSMFSSNVAPFTPGSNSQGPISQLIYFEGLSFSSTTAGTGTVLNDGRFLRIRFDGCSFDYINCCVSTISYTQSIQFTNCNMRRGSGPFWQSGTIAGSITNYYSTDFHFDNNIVEAWKNNFLNLGMARGCSITNNCIEGIQTVPGVPPPPPPPWSVALLLNGAQGCTISGNYFEANDQDIDFSNNGSMNYQCQGVSITGNWFLANTGTVPYRINWGSNTLAGCSSGGNVCGGLLHELPQNSQLAINGDTIYTTAGVVTGLWNNPPITDRGNTSWTPVDASGAGLTFTSVAGNYRMPGNVGFVEFDFEVTYPATASNLAAVIGGLPLASATTGSTNPISGGTTYTNYSAYIQIVSGPGTTSFNLYTLSTALTNANLSGKTIRMFGRYQANI